MGDTFTYYATRMRRAAEHAAGGVRTAPWPAILRWGGAAFALLVIAPVLFLLLADWNTMRGPIARAASGVLNREVTIAGNLDVDPWSSEPLIVADSIRVANPAWAGAGDTIALKRVRLRIAWLPLLAGRIRVTSLDLESPRFTFLREKSGRATWSFGAGDRGRRPLNIPPVRRFHLNDGTLRIVDRKRDILLDAQIRSDEGADGATPFRLSGSGRIDDDPFSIEMTGAALINARRDRPYAFRADIRAGATHLVADGAIAHPFDLGSYTARVFSEGPDLAGLYRLIGVALPNTPPYVLKAMLRRERPRYLLTDIAGRVGDSDLGGTISVDASKDRKFVDARLSSRALDFDDLAVVLGGAPNTGRGESASVGQRAMAAHMRREERLLPDARLDLDRVRSLDARLHYTAGAVRTEWLPLRAASLDLTLDHGILIATPVTFSLPHGDIAATVRLDATHDVPDVNVDVRMTRARVEDFMARSKAPGAISGSLAARAKLRGQGRSIHQAAATADGQVSLVVPHGEIRRAFAELLGVNVTKGLGLLLAKDKEKTDIRCAVADFRARNGALTAQSVVFDTGVVVAHGGGNVSLDTEAVDLKLQGEPKEARLVRVMAPVRITGRLRSPQLGVDLSMAGAQAGIGGALAALLSPVAVILPFVSPGLAQDADCAALVGEARRS